MIVANYKVYCNIVIETKIIKKQDHFIVMTTKKIKKYKNGGTQGVATHQSEGMIKPYIKKIAVVILIVVIAPCLVVEQFIRLPGQFILRLKQTYHLLCFINGISNRKKSETVIKRKTIKTETHGKNSV